MIHTLVIMSIGAVFLYFRPSCGSLLTLLASSLIFLFCTAGIADSSEIRVAPRKACAVLIESLEKELKKQDDEVQKLLLKPDNEGSVALRLNATKQEELKRLMVNLKSSVLPLIQREKFIQASQSLSSYSSIGLRIEEYCALLESIDSELSHRRQNTLGAVSELEDNLAEALLDAEKAEELDDILVAIIELEEETQKWFDHRYGSDRDSSLAQLREITSSWQNYLMAFESGDLRAAQSNISNISRALLKTPIIQRSKVLKIEQSLKVQSESGSTRQNPPYDLHEAVQIVQKVSELEVAEKRCEKLLAYSETKSDAKYLLTTIKQLIEARDSIDAGQISLGLAQLKAMSVNREKAWVLEMTRKLRYLTLPSAIPSKYQKLLVRDSIDTSIPKVAEAMAEDKQWDHLWEYLVACRSVLANSHSAHTPVAGFPWMNNDINAIEKYLAAERYEKAQEYYKAHLTYRLMFDKQGRYAPYELAEQKVASLRNNHAESIKAGEKAATELSAARYASQSSRYSKMSRSGYDPRELEASINKVLEQKLPLYLKANKTPKN
jgi:hypothetical protein